jgi:hypothetical protein
VKSKKTDTSRALIGSGKIVGSHPERLLMAHTNSNKSKILEKGGKAPARIPSKPSVTNKVPSAPKGSGAPVKK